MSKNLRIVFLGTPEFAVKSLAILVENKYNVVAVITNPDKKAGRGQKIIQSDVKKYAISKKIPVLQPTNLKDPLFIKELSQYKPDLQIVVAFRMLPEQVWALPKLGTFNLHASLLPKYRGAAPINWAIINGETETGVTTFFLKHEIDTGTIIFQEKIIIDKNITAGILHDKLMISGAGLVLKTVQAIETNSYKTIEQNSLIDSQNKIKNAPKIFKPDCKINWAANEQNIYNKIRGLSPYPAAWTEIKNTNTAKIISLKIYNAKLTNENHSLAVATILCNKKDTLKIAVNTGFIEITEIQQSGKKRLLINEFLRGFTDIENYILI